MKNILLFISLTANVLVIGFFIYFGYRGYRAATSGASITVAGKIVDVVDYHDAGYSLLSYVVDTPKGKVVVQDFGGIATAHKVGDAVNLREMKNDFSGHKSVSFYISP